TITVRAPQQMSILAKKGSQASDYIREIVWKKTLQAPIEAGDSIGEVRVTKDGDTVATFPLTAHEDIPRSSVWNLTKRTLKKMLFIPDEAQDPEVEQAAK
ncbi:MAG: D-alanyl-D-alanine carboxypeptidase, partial [Novibacillus thermophilus]